MKALMNLKTLLQEIDQRKKELDGYRPFDRETWQKLEQKIRLWWNYHSNAIEGNRLTLGETRALIMHGLTAKGKPLKDHLDIEGHDEAVRYLEEVVQEDHPISEKFIKDLHELILKEPYEVEATTHEGQRITKTIAIGQYKSQDNSVKTQTGEIKHYVSPEETPARMGDLVKWYRKQEEKGELHPVLFAATFHYEFVAIHPFDDGNGRLARLLMNLILMKHSYPPAILRIEERQDQYLAALEEADTGELEPFNTYIGEKVKESLDIYLKAARGEPIEEEDDLDKRIEILDQKLKGNEEVKITKNAEAVSNLMKSTVSPLLETIYTKLKKFKRFFNTFEIFIKTDHSTSKIVNFDFIIPALKQNINLKHDTNIIQVSFKKGTDAFNLASVVTIKLYNSKYSVNIHDLELEEAEGLFKLYHQDFRDEEIKKLADEVSDKILKNIEKRTGTQ